MKTILIIFIVTLTACSTSKFSEFEIYMSNEKACDYINVDTVRSVLSITQDINKEPGYADYIGAYCTLNWDEESKSITIALTKLNNNQAFPPKKLSKEQLLKKLAQIKKQTEATVLKIAPDAPEGTLSDTQKIAIENTRKALLETMTKGAADMLLSQNNYQTINGLGDVATITKLISNNDAYTQSMVGDLIEKQGDIEIYTLSVKLGQILLTTNLSSDIVSNNPKEKLIKLVTHIVKGE